MDLLENFSHESVRKWYKRCKELFDVKRKWRRAVDEIKLFLKFKEIFLFAQTFEYGKFF